jgi:hypothetical protein
MSDELAELRARVARLEAKEACISTFNEYLHYLDGDKHDELLHVFAPDAVVDVIDFPPGSGKDLRFSGHAEIGPFYGVHKGGAGRHNSTNVTVNVEGDEAELSAYFATAGPYAWGGGVYQVTLRPYPAKKKWLIQQMRIVSTWGWRIKSDEPPYLANALGKGALRDGRPVIYRMQ